MSEQKYTGQYGIVILFDKDTENKVRDIAEKYTENDISFGNKGERSVPHLTLYHAYLRDVPQSFAQNLLQEIVVPTHIVFENMSVFGGSFIFWETSKTKVLYTAHQKALGLSSYYVSVREDIKKEKIVISSCEQKNIETYGHPLVLKSWNPHITVAYHSSIVQKGSTMISWKARPRAVAFVEIGLYATAKDITLIKLL